MKIHYIGLSCFMIENNAGFRLLVDPFMDVPEWQLGINFPRIFAGKSFGANIVLSSEPDADHTRSHGDWLQNAPETKPNSNPFPALDLRGTVIYEYNGDVNIAYHYTVDGMRLLHLADNAQTLTEEQLKEIGTPDIIFISPDKITGEKANDAVRKNIENLKPKIIFWAHQIVPKDLPKVEDSETLRAFFIKHFKDHASTNQFYKGEESFVQIGYILENAIILNKEYNGETLHETNIEINEQTLVENKDKPKSFLFRSMLSD